MHHQHREIQLSSGQKRYSNFVPAEAVFNLSAIRSALLVSEKI